MNHISSNMLYEEIKSITRCLKQPDRDEEALRDILLKVDFSHICDYLNLFNKLEKELPDIIVYLHENPTFAGKCDCSPYQDFASLELVLGKFMELDIILKTLHVTNVCTRCLEKLQILRQKFDSVIGAVTFQSTYIEIMQPKNLYSLIEPYTEELKLRECKFFIDAKYCTPNYLDSCLENIRIIEDFGLFVKWVCPYPIIISPNSFLPETIKFFDYPRMYVTYPDFPLQDEDVGKTDLPLDKFYDWFKHLDLFNSSKSFHICRHVITELVEKGMMDKLTICMEVFDTYKHLEKRFIHYVMELETYHPEVIDMMDFEKDFPVDCYFYNDWKCADNAEYFYQITCPRNLFFTLSNSFRKPNNNLIIFKRFITFSESIGASALLKVSELFDLNYCYTSDDPEMYRAIINHALEMGVPAKCISIHVVRITNPDTWMEEKRISKSEITRNFRAIHQLTTDNDIHCYTDVLMRSDKYNMYDILDSEEYREFLKLHCKGNKP